MNLTTKEILTEDARFNAYYRHRYSVPAHVSLASLPNAYEEFECWCASAAASAAERTQLAERLALADKVIAAFDSLNDGCADKSWIEWQDGNGKYVGKTIERRLAAYRKAMKKASKQWTTQHTSSLPSAWRAWRRPSITFAI